MHLDDHQLAAERNRTLPVDPHQFADCQRLFQQAATRQIPVRSPTKTLFVMDGAGFRLPDTPANRAMFAVGDFVRDLDLSEREFKSLLFRTYLFPRLVNRPEVAAFVKLSADGMGKRPCAGLTVAGARAKISHDQSGMLDYDIPDVLAIAAEFSERHGA